MLFNWSYSVSSMCLNLHLIVYAYDFVVSLGKNSWLNQFKSLSFCHQWLIRVLSCPEFITIPTSQ